MFKISNLSKKYKNNDRYSVKGLNIEIKDGEIFGFLGPNGAGKSTTIKSVVGILPYGTAQSDGSLKRVAKGKELSNDEIIQSQSSISIDGIELNQFPKEYKKRIAYVSDNHAVFERLTGMEYVNHIANLYDVSEEDRNLVIEKYSKIFNLGHAINRPISGYSHGMKQKINVIAALVHKPKLWVLDEPMLGLDPVSSFELKNAMREHANAGNIVLFSSHMIDVVYAICDKVGIIVDGVLRGIYSVKELKKKNVDLERVFINTIANAGCQEESKLVHVCVGFDGKPVDVKNMVKKSTFIEKVESKSNKDDKTAKVDKSKDTKEEKSKNIKEKSATTKVKVVKAEKQSKNKEEQK